MDQPAAADVVFMNGRFTTLDRRNPAARCVAIRDGRFIAVGDAAAIAPHIDASTRRHDLAGRAALPGLHDSHLHLIPGGLHYNLELRWDGVPSLAEAMAMLRKQALRTPPPQWLRVVGGFSEHQFAEKRLPTLAEINAAAPDTLVFILHLHDRALLNAAALRAIGYTRDTSNPPGGEIQRDAAGKPTGLLLACPDPQLLHAALARSPVLSPADQLNSTRLFMRELNRLGVTSVIDAGSDVRHYPDDYATIETLAKNGELTLRIAYNLLARHPGQEFEDFREWTAQLPALAGDAFYRHNGAGETLLFAAADFADFREPRPELVSGMEDQLERVIRLLVAERWPFRLHATYDESIARALDVFERVDQDLPFTGLHWFFDHAETISPHSIDRVRALGGGIAIQHRMAYQGEYFAAHYGARAVAHTPPIRRMLAAGLPVGAGTDATGGGSYNPWVCLYWMITGKTLGGYRMYHPDNLVDRETALRLWTTGSAWFSNDDGTKGSIAVGQLADFIVPSADYFAVPDEDIKDLVSELTVLGGRIVHAGGSFAVLAPPLPPASPDWSPVNTWGGYHLPTTPPHRPHDGITRPCDLYRHAHPARPAPPALPDAQQWWGAMGCSCWV